MQKLFTEVLDPYLKNQKSLDKISILNNFSRAFCKNSKNFSLKP